MASKHKLGCCKFGYNDPYVFQTSFVTVCYCDICLACERFQSHMSWYTSAHQNYCVYIVYFSFGVIPTHTPHLSKLDCATPTRILSLLKDNVQVGVASSMDPQPRSKSLKRHHTHIIHVQCKDVGSNIQL